MREDLLRKVAMVQMEGAKYPHNPPFNPPEKYPEYPYSEIDGSNAVYRAIRDILIELSLDADHYGTAEWNPLGDIVHPGDNVVIKPNFVSEPRADNTDPHSIVTHGSVIRPIIDYCHKALKGKGSLVIADAPQTDSNFEKIKEITCIQDVVDFVNGYSTPKVSLLDLRESCSEVYSGIVLKRNKINGDPKGYTLINLGNKSQFHDIDRYMNKAYGADYDYEELRKHHSGGKHEYYISNTILKADVIINVPKLKTHKKTGVTLCLKNLVGINGNKNYLPHYRFGSKEDGGDEYLGKSSIKYIGSELYQLIFKTMAKLGPKEMALMEFPRQIYSYLNKKNITKNTGGSWYGNDTLWRTIIDLNMILFYADKNGQITDDIQRSYLAIVDGIVAGDGDGPLFPAPKYCGIILGGFNPIIIDRLGASVMGFNWEKIPHISKAQQTIFDEKHIKVPEQNINLNFNPPPGWEHQI